MATTARLHPDLVPALALMTFAGIRPDHEDGEIVKLKWDHLILKDREKRVELPSTITKTGKRRTIKVRPALASWLQWHKDRTKGNDEACTGLVCPIKGQKLRTKLREIFNDSKVKRIQDGLRHSFASYLAPIDGLDKVEAELGHIGGREVLNRHYRSDVRATVAKKFWAMRAPQKTQTKTGKILQFKAA
jgi:integrase